MRVLSAACLAAFLMIAPVVAEARTEDRNALIERILNLMPGPEAVDRRLDMEVGKRTNALASLNPDRVSDISALGARFRGCLAEFVGYERIRSVFKQSLDQGLSDDELARVASILESPEFIASVSDPNRRAEFMSKPLDPALAKYMSVLAAGARADAAKNRDAIAACDDQLNAEAARLAMKL